MKRLFQHIKDFSGLTPCFIIAVFVVKIIEICIAIGADVEIADFGDIVCGNLISCGYVSLVIFILYSLLSFISNRTAQWTASFLFGMVIIFEIGLVIYHDSTGLLMGKELITRPLWETVHTIRGFASTALILVVIVLWICYVVFSKWISKKINNKYLALVMAFLMLVSTPLFFILEPYRDSVTVNKTWYFVRECLKKQKLCLDFTKSSLDNDVIEKHNSMFLRRQIIDRQYPLERKDNVENVLGTYFKTSEVKPNVVIIVVESLGADIFGVNDCGYCYTPFLDSLSKHSLLWTNCLSTTPRSFGAVPAITGSVPHGLKGFQFGNIPEHNSIISILKDNGYKTNAFYAGNFSFDRIYDYLVEQNIDYMSPFYYEYFADKSETKEGTYWGYHDVPMFEKSLKIIEEEPENQHSLNLLITITQHDNLSLKDKALQQKFYDEVEAIIESQPKGCQDFQKKFIGKLASTLYTDHAIREFFNGYNADCNLENTIFVITGDHGMNLNETHTLEEFNVPLIIWSPLLKHPDRFEAVVSHNDIAPSLTALLRDNFGMKTPNTVHWVSDGLDTVHTFHSTMKTYFLRYNREVSDFVYDNYYYTSVDGKKQIYKIKSRLNLEKTNDISFASMEDKLVTMVFVDNYVYSNNRLTANPISRKIEDEIIEDIKLPDSIYCASKPEKPSVMKPNETLIFIKKIEGVHRKLRLVVEADIKYTGKIKQDRFADLILKCRGNKMQSVYSSDYVSKFIMDRDLKFDKWSRFEFSKILSTENSEDVELKLYLLPTSKDEMWDPEHTITLKNVEIKVYDVENQ